MVESSITEDTLNQEMVVAAEAHRDNIQKMTAIPPLVVDEHRLQLQIRCAAAEDNSEDLKLELQATEPKLLPGLMPLFWLSAFHKAILYAKLNAL